MNLFVTFINDIFQTVATSILVLLVMRVVSPRMKV